MADQGGPDGGTATREHGHAVRRNTGVEQELGKGECDQRGLLGGLEDDPVAADQGRRHLVGDQVERVVEGCDRSDHADRLAGVPAEAVLTAGGVPKGRVWPSSRSACSAERRTVSTARCTSRAAPRMVLQPSREISSANGLRRSWSRAAAAVQGLAALPRRPGGPAQHRQRHRADRLVHIGRVQSPTRPTSSPSSGFRTSMAASGRCHRPAQKAPPAGVQGGSRLFMRPTVTCPSDSIVNCKLLTTYRLVMCW